MVVRGGGVSYEAAIALLAFLAAALSASIFSNCSLPSTLGGIPISPAVTSVAFGADFAMASARGPKEGTVLGTLGLLGSLRKVPLVAGGVQVIMIGGVE